MSALGPSGQSPCSLSSAACSDDLAPRRILLAGGGIRLVGLLQAAQGILSVRREGVVPCPVVRPPLASFCQGRRGPMQRFVLTALLLTLDIAASWVSTAPALRPRRDTHTRRAASTTRRAASITAAVGGGARLIYCEGLSKSYDGQRFQFRDISLGVATGQRVGLIGVNGVGKSTLMKCLAGLEQHDAGRSAVA